MCLTNQIRHLVNVETFLEHYTVMLDVDVITETREFYHNVQTKEVINTAKKP